MVMVIVIIVVMVIIRVMLVVMVKTNGTHMVRFRLICKILKLKRPWCIFWFHLGIEICCKKNKINPLPGSYGPGHPLVPQIP